MKLQNRQTKEIVEVTKNEDGSYTAEGKTYSKEDVQRHYMKPKDEEKEEEISPDVITESISTQSDDLGELGKALALCQGEFEAIHKGKSGHGYNYADLEAVLDASRAITSKHGLSVVQMNMSKTIGGHLLVGVRTMLLHESGGWISGEIYVPAKAKKPNTLVQMAGVNITYLRRYGLQSILGLATTDTDGV